MALFATSIHQGHLTILIKWSVANMKGQFDLRQRALMNSSACSYSIARDLDRRESSGLRLRRSSLCTETNCSTY